MVIIFVSDDEIKKLNKRWFGKNGPTDVITFGEKWDEFAEIYISVDTAKRQARERGIKVWQELLRLAVHGLVHVEGYDDTDLDSFCRMREREWGMLIKCAGN